MKKSLAHLPQHKQNELNLITRLIRDKFPEAHMIILFGSYARDTWVEETYVEDKVIYEYISDFDIMLVTKDQKTAKQARKQTFVETAIERKKQIKTPVNIIYHGISHVNNSISQGHYFFVDIKKEGIVLYDSKKYKLAESKQLTPAQKKNIVKEDFEQWFESAKGAYLGYKMYLEIREYKWAAFMLHQTAERFYHTLIITFTGKKPKMHNLETLGKRAAEMDGQFLQVFPRNTEQQDENFKLLKRAYVDARYKKDYKITKKQLEYLATRVRKLQRLTKKICTEKIESFV
jgi:HEPN domain-containing protein/predicted nucleotidyltransferase